MDHVGAQVVDALMLDVVQIVLTLDVAQDALFALDIVTTVILDTDRDRFRTGRSKP